MKPEHALFVSRFANRFAVNLPDDAREIRVLVPGTGAFVDQLIVALLKAAMSRLALLSLRFGTLILVLFDVVLSHFPGLVRIVFVHALERLQRIGTEILW